VANACNYNVFDVPGIWPHWQWQIKSIPEVMACMRQNCQEVTRRLKVRTILHERPVP